MTARKRSPTPRRSPSPLSSPPSRVKLAKQAARHVSPFVRAAANDFVTGFTTGTQHGTGPHVSPPHTFAGHIGFVVGFKRKYKEAQHPRIPKGNGRASGRYRSK